MFVLCATITAAPANIGGEWSVEFGGDVDTVPDMTMYIARETCTAGGSDRSASRYSARRNAARSAFSCVVNARLNRTS
jgi:hypothetical protein